MAARTLPALTHEIACSLLRPPKTTATRGLCRAARPFSPALSAGMFATLSGLGRVILGRREQLVEGAGDLLRDLVEVRNTVEVAEQTEVDLSVVTDDRHGEQVCRSKEGEGEDRQHLA